VEADGGVMTLTGTLRRRSQAVALAEVARAVDGVIAARSHLTFEQNDLDGVRPPWRSRSSCPLKVWLTDSTSCRSGRNNPAPARVASPLRAGRNNCTPNPASTRSNRWPQ
jgi:hypothetical protein